MVLPRPAPRRYVRSVTHGGDVARTYAARLRARHGLRLAGDVVGYAVVNRVWWILPLVALLGLAALLIVIGQAAAPITLYPMF